MSDTFVATAEDRALFRTPISWAGGPDEGRELSLPDCLKSLQFPMHSLHKGQRVPCQRPPLKPKDGLNRGPPKVNIRFAQDASQAQHDAFPKMGVSKN
jgi:hypothetical protein